MYHCTEKINHNSDILNTRDIIERIAYLDEYEDDLAEDSETLDECETEERETLELLIQECRDNSSEVDTGEQLIHAGHFTGYAQQFAEDLGLVSDNDQWPTNCIDWDQAADALLADYGAVDFDGETFYIRNS